jgi:rubrerythrin
MGTEEIMQFDKTQTYGNLARGFAGESQAGMRYQLIAQAAEQQGYFQLAEVIKTIAKNETVHARRFFEELQNKGTKLDNIVLDAGYPFHAGDIEAGLKFAAQDEREEHAKIYPAFAATAREEGFEDIAALFLMVARVEEHHESIFKYLYDAFKNGTLYSNEKPILFICSECGHMYTGTKAWDICPLCKSAQGYVELHLPYKKENI